MYTFFRNMGFIVLILGLIALGSALYMGITALTIAVLSSIFGTLPDVMQVVVGVIWFIIGMTIVITLIETNDGF